MNAQTVRHLQSAKALIQDEVHWTRGTYARDANYDETDSLSPSAVCWCAIGALSKATDGWIDLHIWDVIDKATYEVAGHTNTAKFNDSHSHAEVLELFDKAIEIAEKGVLV